MLSLCIIPITVCQNIQRGDFDCAEYKFITFYFFFSKTDQRVLERIFNLFSYSFHFLHWSSESIVDFGGFIPVYSRRTISILSIHFVFFVSLVLILAFILCNWKQLNFSAHTKNTMDYPNRFYFNPLVLWLKFLAC